MTRSVRLSQTARDLFKTMLAQGAEKFDVDVADDVIDTLENYLAEYRHRSSP